ncbi:MAG: zinc metallopeptidase [Isosphaeraceae bacterium]
MLLDVEYVILGLPGVLAPAWAWWSSSAALARAARSASSTGLTGAEAARAVMEAGGMVPAPIEVAAGPLADYYEPGGGILRLSEPVHSGRSLAAIGVATHEAGHAVQAAERSPWRLVRRAAVPLADLSSILAWQLLLAGTLLGIFRLTLWGLALVWLALAVQLVNLGAEYDASRRASRLLEKAGLLDRGPEAELARVHRAAAWAHVAAVFAGFPALVGRFLASAARVLRARA